MDQNTRAIAAFWGWLSAQQPALNNLITPDDPFWDAVLTQLHAVHAGLWFEVSNGPFTPREFVITAQGDTRLFQLVDTLAAAAPNLPGWKIVALKQPQADDPLVEMKYEGRILDPSKMWFSPLTAKSDPTRLALRIAVPGFQEEDRNTFTTAILIMLDSLLGERDAALQVHRVFPCQVPSDPASAGFIEFTQLPAFIAWRKRR